MANTVIGLYNDASTAERVIDDLTDSGFNRSTIDMHRESDASGLHSELVDEGIPRDDADYYVEGLRDGGVLVSVHADDSDTDKAVDIMNRYADEGGYEDKRSLGSDVDRNIDAGIDDAERKTGLDTGLNAASAGIGDKVDETIEVAEEKLRVGKRQTQRGGVRVRSRVVEEDVSEDVTLRDETVNVDRQSVDREASSADGDLFQERTIEVAESSEEAVVDKEARVTEEIRVGKEVSERTETVSDTVRRTEVDVEEDVDTNRNRGDDFRSYDSDFRAHFDDSSDNGSYEEAEPAYRYGHTAASDSRYEGREFGDAEDDLRRDWEKRNEGSWDNHRDAIRYSYNQTRSRR